MRSARGANPKRNSRCTWGSLFDLYQGMSPQSLQKKHQFGGVLLLGHVRASRLSPSAVRRAPTRALPRRFCVGCLCPVWESREKRGKLGKTLGSRGMHSRGKKPATKPASAIRTESDIPRCVRVPLHALSIPLSRSGLVHRTWSRPSCSLLPGARAPSRRSSRAPGRSQMCQVRTSHPLA